MLLDIFEKNLGVIQTPHFWNALDINPSSDRILLQQDRSVSFYASKIVNLFIKNLDRDHEDILINWQMLQTYRVLNAALASVRVDESIKAALGNLKKEMETTPFLAKLLESIDAGRIRRLPVVCSGHGKWYEEDGYVDLETVDSSVVLISGEGAALADRLGVALENGLFEPDKWVVVRRGEGEKFIEPIDPSPRFFSKKNQQKQVPNLCLIDDKDHLPKPRVIEPLTGRVLYDLQSKQANDNKENNYFYLADVLQKLNGQEREVRWAACTGVRALDRKKAGEFLGYKWMHADHAPKKRRLDVENDATKRIKVEEAAVTPAQLSI